MQESKYQVLKWKQWKFIRKLLIEIKHDIAIDKKAISYSLEMPGGNHHDVIKRYNKLIDSRDKYDQYILAYDLILKRVEDSIANLLNKEERTVIIIYSNYPDKGDSFKREEEAMRAGYSRTSFYAIANQAFNKLDKVLDIELKIDNDFIKNEDGTLTLKHSGLFPD